MAKARDLLRAVERYSQAMLTPEQMLQELPDDKFRIAFFAAAELFKTFKDEAIRRGVWDEFKTKKVK